VKIFHRFFKSPRSRTSSACLRSLFAGRHLKESQCQEVEGAETTKQTPKEGENFKGTLVHPFIKFCVIGLSVCVTIFFCCNYYCLYIFVQASEPELLQASENGVKWRVSGKGRGTRREREKEEQRRSKWT